MGYMDLRAVIWNVKFEDKNVYYANHSASDMIFTHKRKCIAWNLHGIIWKKMTSAIQIFQFYYCIEFNGGINIWRKKSK